MKFAFVDVVGFLASLSVFVILWGWVLQLKQNYQNKTCENLNPTLFIACGFAYFFYGLYGWKRPDYFIAVPNSIGFALAFGLYYQMWLYGVTKSPAVTDPVPAQGCEHLCPVLYRIGDMVLPTEVPIFGSFGTTASAIHQEMFFTVKDITHSCHTGGWWVHFKETEQVFRARDFYVPDNCMVSYLP